MKKKNLALYFTVFILTFLAVSFVATQILAIPLWWIFGFMHSLNVIGSATLQVTVTPETPLNINDRITVTAKNSSSQSPVEGAEVVATKDSQNVTVFTDSNGQTSFPYFGGVTVITVQKTGFNPSYPIAIPRMPDSWVMNLLISLGSAVVGGLITVFGTFMLRERKEKIGKIATRRRKK